MRFLLAAVAVALSGCATVPPDDPQAAFFANLRGHCGKALNGRMVSSDPQDNDMSGKPMLATFGPCSDSKVRINFAVGPDLSRNWVVTRTQTGLRLKHVHIHDDGSEDELSRYGGDTVAPGSATRQEFPTDAFSRDLFTRRNSAQSNTNVWAMEVATTTPFAYELRRPGRYFRVQFDDPARASIGR